MDIDKIIDENLEGMWYLVRDSKTPDADDLIYHYKGVIKAMIEDSCIEYVRENAWDMEKAIMIMGTGDVIRDWADRKQQEWESK